MLVWRCLHGWGHPLNGPRLPSISTLLWQPLVAEKRWFSSQPDTLFACELHVSNVQVYYKQVIEPFGEARSADLVLPTSFEFFKTADPSRDLQAALQRVSNL